MIGERPAVAERRSRLGDWEIDPVHGQTKAGVVPLVERRSDLVRIGNAQTNHDGANRKADNKMALKR